MEESCASRGRDHISDLPRLRLLVSFEKLIANEKQRGTAVGCPADSLRTLCLLVERPELPLQAQESDRDAHCHPRLNPPDACCPHRASGGWECVRPITIGLWLQGTFPGSGLWRSAGLQGVCITHRPGRAAETCVWACGGGEPGGGSLLPGSAAHGSLALGAYLPASSPDGSVPVGSFGARVGALGPEGSWQALHHGAQSACCVRKASRIAWDSRRKRAALCPGRPGRPH